MTPSLKSAAILLLVTSLAASVFAQSDAPATYKSKCAPCHGTDGQATTPAGKALRAASFKSPSVIKASDAELFAAVKNGKNKMPAWNGKLTDDQIKALVAYVRTLQK